MAKLSILVLLIIGLVLASAQAPPGNNATTVTPANATVPANTTGATNETIPVAANTTTTNATRNDTGVAPVPISPNATTNASSNATVAPTPVPAPSPTTTNDTRTSNDTTQDRYLFIRVNVPITRASDQKELKDVGNAICRNVGLNFCQRVEPLRQDIEVSDNKTIAQVLYLMVLNNTAGGNRESVQNSLNRQMEKTQQDVTNGLKSERNPQILIIDKPENFDINSPCGSAKNKPQCMVTDTCMLNQDCITHRCDSNRCIEATAKGGRTGAPSSAPLAIPSTSLAAASAVAGLLAIVIAL